jgi:hypothetical protein
LRRGRWVLTPHDPPPGGIVAVGFVLDPHTVHDLILAPA